MAHEINGTIVKIGQTQTVSDKFRKREFVLEHVPEQSGNFAPRPQYIKFEVSGDRCETLDSFAEGQTVDVKFDVEGRAWVNPKGETVYFNTLRAWGIYGQKNGSAPQTSPAQKSQLVPEPKPVEDDDMPF